MLMLCPVRTVCSLQEKCSHARYHENNEDCKGSVEMPKCPGCVGGNIGHNPEGVKHDQGKPDWTLLPFDALEEVVKVLDFGAQKYSRDNWQKVEPHRERYGAAALRHFVAWFNGETIDKESGRHHLACAVCCLLFLLWHDLRDGK